MTNNHIINSKFLNENDELIITHKNKEKKILLNKERIKYTMKAYPKVFLIQFLSSYLSTIIKIKATIKAK